MLLPENSDPKICCDCIGEPFLHKLVENEGEVASCYYCGGEEEPCVSIGDLADYIEGAFERHYYRTSDQPDDYESMLQRDKEIDYEWTRHGESVLYVIQEAAMIAEDIARDVLDILDLRNSDIEMSQMGEEWEFSSESRYEPKGVDDQEFAFEWQGIEHSLKSESRFFNRSADSFLARLFSELDGRVTHGGRPVVITAGPDSEHRSFFRARVFHRSEELEMAMKRPDLHIGPPPGRLARAGRMNANGISMFYGASDKAVALAEVRPPVGSRALIGEFQLIRPVRLLDVTALQSVYVTGSIFDPNYLKQLELAKFMERLSERITMPVTPDDEPTEYLITQMIADYLAGRPAPGLDGILFPSVQCPGEHRNVALFHHASRVELMDLPEGTELSARQYESTEDGDEPDYLVWEEIPPPPEKLEEPKLKSRLFSMFEPVRYDPSEDTRENTLRVVAEEVTAHHIKGVTFATEDYSVLRRRIAKRKWKLA